MGVLRTVGVAVATLARIFLFVVGWVVGPFPWSFISKHIVSDGVYGSKLDFAADALVSGGFVVNAALVLWAVGLAAAVGYSFLASWPWD